VKYKKYFNQSKNPRDLSDHKEKAKKKGGTAGEFQKQNTDYMDTKLLWGLTRETVGRERDF